MGGVWLAVLVAAALMAAEVAAKDVAAKDVDVGSKEVFEKGGAVHVVVKDAESHVSHRRYYHSLAARYKKLLKPFLIHGRRLIFHITDVDKLRIASVTRDEFKSCQLRSSSPLPLKDIPNSSEKLAEMTVGEAAGTKVYFMSTNPEICRKGMKFKMRVRAPPKPSIFQKIEKKASTMANLKSGATPSLTLISSAAAIAIALASFFLFLFLL